MENSKQSSLQYFHYDQNEVEQYPDLDTHIKQVFRWMGSLLGSKDTMYISNLLPDPGADSYTSQPVNQVPNAKAYVICQLGA